MKISILSDKNNYIASIRDERNSWIHSVIKNSGISIDEKHFESKINLAKVLDELKVSIIHFSVSDEYKILKEGDLIATWGTPNFILKRDKETNELYYLIEIECWSKFDRQP